MKKAILSTALTSILLSAGAHAKETFNICFSTYVGWEPYALMESTGALERAEKKYNVDINIELVPDYIESINLYTLGNYTACAMTTLDALTIPAVSGLDSSAIIFGDYSNGNDGIVIKGGNSVSDLAGQDVHLVELSVSHYLLARALEKAGLSERDLNIVNTSDADLAALVLSKPEFAAVTWNPPLMTVLSDPEANLVFDSSDIPGEIMDVLVARTDAPDNFKAAITEAWYEVMGLLNDPQTAEPLIAEMAANSGSTISEFKAQLRTTHMFYDPAEATAAMESKSVKDAMDFVRTFSFSKGLFGQYAQSPDVVGIQFPDGSVLGDPTNVKLRFTSQYMAEVAAMAAK